MKIWPKLVLLGLFGVAVMPAVAQHRDPFVYEKLRQQDEHLKSTDSDVKENVKAIREVQEQLDHYKDYAIGFAGCFTMFIAFLKFIGRKGDQSA